MIEYKKVETTNQNEFILLMISVFVILVGLIKLLVFFRINNSLTLLCSFALIAIYFYILKRKLVRKSDFRIFEDRFEYAQKRIPFDTINEYKIHWLKGAGLKIKLNNGETIRINSNDHFCKAHKFVQFCMDLDDTLENYKDGRIVRKKSIFETKYGDYYWFTISYLSVIGLISSFYRDDTINLMTAIIIAIVFAIILVLLLLKLKR